MEQFPDEPRKYIKNVSLVDDFNIMLWLSYSNRYDCVHSFIWITAMCKQQGIRRKAHHIIVVID